ncbi:hypothetical protein HPB47_005413 [Ixodes persulcatus]|uniref:Uncharacterized protein n=1 Tax=Ixodes persulcatus TaxID=34615 RepID=A0AC60PD17_IXOPE|nr:hypothetical protein HPB47_005413 [Ixodes persulcatus]
MTLAVTNLSGPILTAGSMHTSNSAEAEETAIALALTLSTTKVTVSDSQMAIRQYMRGHISDKALKIATWSSPDRPPIPHPVASSPCVTPRTRKCSQCGRALTHRASTPREHSTFASWSNGNLYTFKGVVDTLVVSMIRMTRLAGTVARSPRSTIYSGVPELVLYSKNKDFIKQVRKPGAWEYFLLDPDPKTQKIIVQLASDAAGNIASRLSTKGFASSEYLPKRGTLDAIKALPDIVSAVRGRVEIYLDGGVRQGTDVVKALALGAKAVFIGRPALWGLAYNARLIKGESASATECNVQPPLQCVFERMSEGGA